MSEIDKDFERIPLREQDVHEIAFTLQRILGQRLVAYAIGEQDPRQVDAYALTLVEADKEKEAKLRDLAEITELGLEQEGSDEVLRASMIGMHPNLEDRSIIEVLRTEDSQKVVSAARSGLLFY